MRENVSWKSRIAFALVFVSIALLAFGRTAAAVDPEIRKPLEINRTLVTTLLKPVRNWCAYVTLAHWQDGAFVFECLAGYGSKNSYSGKLLFSISRKPNEDSARQLLLAQMVLAFAAETAKLKTEELRARAPSEAATMYVDGRSYTVDKPGDGLSKERIEVENLRFIPKH